MNLTFIARQMTLELTMSRKSLFLSQHKIPSIDHVNYQYPHDSNGLALFVSPPHAMRK